jgi:6-phosphogluconolactonase
VNRPTLRITSDADELAERAAVRFLQAAGEAISQNRRFTAALSGGSTPERLYTLLA